MYAFSKKESAIDFEKAEREVLAAIEKGVNYFDTAYIYPGSEECLGKILAKNLVHMFTDFHEWENLQALGIEDWIKEQKSKGTIKNIGFSYHGETGMFLKILNAYDWDFCNYYGAFA